MSSFLSKYAKIIAMTRGSRKVETTVYMYIGKHIKWFQMLYMLNLWIDFVYHVQHRIYKAKKLKTILH